MRKILIAAAMLTLTILVLPATRSATYAAPDGPTLSPQDTAQAGQMRMRMRVHQDSVTGMHGMSMRGMRGMRSMQGRRMGMGGSMHGMVGFNHVGPRMFIGLKDELGLTDDQVGQLEKIHEGHHSLMMAQQEALTKQREATAKAQAVRDWDAVETSIDEGTKILNGMQKGLVQVERQTWDVLTAEQREKFDTWQEGARLMQRQRREGMRSGRGMQRRMRVHADSVGAK
jgi:Spy/CpxP family protein refolding chaperone